MSLFSYSAAISNLVGNQAGANVTNLVTCLNDVKTFLNGSNLDETSNVPNLAAAFTTYKRLQRGSGQDLSMTAGNTYLHAVDGAATALVNTANAATTHFLFRLDPADFNANSRTTKLFLRSTVITNATAPAVTITCGLYPIATYGGAAGFGPTVASVGTVVSGSTVAIASPSAGGPTTGTSGDFTCPAAGNYLFALTSSGTQAVNSVIEVVFELFMRQV